MLPGFFAFASFSAYLGTPFSAWCSDFGPGYATGGSGFGLGEDVLAFNCEEDTFRVYWTSGTARGHVRVRHLGGPEHGNGEREGACSYDVTLEVTLQVQMQPAALTCSTVGCWILAVDLCGWNSNVICFGRLFYEWYWCCRTLWLVLELLKLTAVFLSSSLWFLDRLFSFPV